MVPLYQFPNIAAWRTDQVGGPVDEDAANYQAFQNINQWKDTNGDGQIVIGAEQWPECLNPITECANSSWYGVDHGVQGAPQRVGHHLDGYVRGDAARHRRAQRRRSGDHQVSVREMT